MANQSWARVERQALSDLLAEAGPDAPTLCQGWDTGDLAAHLVLREHRLDAAPGIMLPQLAGYTERVQRRLREGTPYPRLVERFRQGPPAWSPFTIAAADARANTVEYFVHHEDVRRAHDGWEPRELPDDVEDQLWRNLKSARLILRRLPVEITLVDSAGRAQRVTKGGKPVQVRGRASELTLWALGRKQVARVELTGEADATDALDRGHWGL